MAHVETADTGPQWHRDALTRLAQTMVCTSCGVVGLRLEWKDDRGVYSCATCGSSGVG